MAESLYGSISAGIFFIPRFFPSIRSTFYLSLIFFVYFFPSVWTNSPFDASLPNQFPKNKQPRLFIPLLIYTQAQPTHLRWVLFTQFRLPLSLPYKTPSPSDIPPPPSTRPLSPLLYSSPPVPAKPPKFVLIGKTIPNFEVNIRLVLPPWNQKTLRPYWILHWNISRKNWSKMRYLGTRMRLESRTKSIVWI